MSSWDLFEVKSGPLGGCFSHALTLERQPVRIVYEPIEDGVGDGRIGDCFVPVIDRQLAGHNRRTAVVPILDNLKNVAALLGGERGEAPIVQDQQLDARQALEQPGMTPIAASECESIEQPWHAMIEDGAIVAAGLVAKRTGKPTFAGSGRPADQQALVPCDPIAGDELGEQRLIETALGLDVDILDDGRLAQACELQSADEFLVLALDGLAVDHE